MKIKKYQYAIPNFGANYDDLPPTPVISAKLGATAPTLATFKGNVQQFTFDNTGDFIIGTTELLHGYKEGSTIHPHVHWATNGVDLTDRTVKWQLEYTISNVNEEFPTSVIITGEDTILASTADRTQLLTSLTDISGTGIKIGSYIAWRFSRIASSGIEPSNNPFALAVGFHVEQNTIGSRQIGTK